MLLECYYFFLHRQHRKNYSLINQKKIEKNSYVFVVHNMHRTGAVLLSYHILEKMKVMGKDFVIISLLHGPMAEEFSNLYHLEVVPERRISKIIKRLEREYGCNKIICNSLFDLFRFCRTSFFSSRFMCRHKSINTTPNNNKYHQPFMTGKPTFFLIHLFFPLVLILNHQ